MAEVLEVYSMHGHVNAGTVNEAPLDYQWFFRKLPSDPRGVIMLHDYAGRSDSLWRPRPSARIVRTKQVVGVGGSCVFLDIAVQYPRSRSVPKGDEGYDVACGAPQGDADSDGGVRVFVVPKDRIVFVDSPASWSILSQIEQALVKYGTEYLDMRGLTISLNPVPASSFFEKLASVSNITRMTLVMRRPNLTWSEDAKGLIGDVLARANADSVTLRLDARSGMGGERDNELASTVADHLSSSITGIKNVTMWSDSGQLSLKRSVLKVRIPHRGGNRYRDVLSSCYSWLLQTSSQIRERGKKQGHE